MLYNVMCGPSFCHFPLSTGWNVDLGPWEQGQHLRDENTIKWKAPGLLTALQSRTTKTTCILGGEGEIYYCLCSYKTPLFGVSSVHRRVSVLIIRHYFKIFLKLLFPCLKAHFSETKDQDYVMNVLPCWFKLFWGN